MTARGNLKGLKGKPDQEGRKTGPPIESKSKRGGDSQKKQDIISLINNKKSWKIVTQGIEM
jgi:hypothetical protein